MAQVAVAVAVSAALSFAAAQLTPKPKPTAQDLAITSSAYGDAIPIIYSSGRVACHLIWSDGVKHQKSNGKFGKGSGGKGKASKPPYTYTANLAFSVCEGPVDQLLTIWANGAIIYDARGTARDNQTNNLIGTGKYRIRFYTGTETQMPASLIEHYVDATNGPGSTPAFRGLAYIVIEGMDLTAFGNQVPNLHAEVTHAATSSLQTSILTNVTSPSFSTASGTVLFDYTADLMYVITGNGISVWDLSSDTEIRQKTWASISADAGTTPPSPDYFPSACWALTPNGYIVGGSWTNHRGWSTGYATFICLDRITLAYLPSKTSTLQNIYWPVALYGVPVQVQYSPGYQSDYVIAVELYGLPAVYDANLKLTLWRPPSGFIDSGDVFGAGQVARVVLSEPEEQFTHVYFFAPVIRSGTVGICRLELYPSAPYTDLSGNLQSGAGLVATKMDVLDLAADFGLTGNFTLGDVQIDLTDNSLIINLLGLGSTQSCMFKWMAGTGVVWYRTDVAFHTLAADSGGGTGSSLIMGGKYGVWSGARGMLIDTSAGETVWDSLTTLGSVIPSPTGASGSMVAYDGRTRSTLMWDQSNGKFFRIYLQGFEPGTTTVGGIVADVCSRVGLAGSDIDVSALTTSVSGYVVGRRTDAKAILEQLGEFYFFDAVESDAIMKFVPRGASPALTITQDDLGETRTDKGKSTKDDNYWKHQHKQEFEIPAVIHVKTFDPARNLQYGDQQYRRTKAPFNTMNAKSIVTMEAPLVMSADEATQIAQKSLFTRWVQRDTYETTLGWKYLYLDPTDVVTVTMTNGDSYVARTVKETVGGNLIMTMAFEADDAATYSSTAVGASGDGLIVPANSLNTLLTSTLLLDLPLIRDIDSLGQFAAPLYIACVTYTSATWPGAELYRSKDGANTYEDRGPQTSQPFSGTTVNALASTLSPFMLDTTTTLTVFPFRGVTTTLNSSTMAGLDSGANIALVGSDDSA